MAGPSQIQDFREKLDRLRAALSRNGVWRTDYGSLSLDSLFRERVEKLVSRLERTHQIAPRLTNEAVSRTANAANDLVQFLVHLSQLPEPAYISAKSDFSSVLDRCEAEFAPVWAQVTSEIAEEVGLFNPSEHRDSFEKLNSQVQATLTEINRVHDQARQAAEVAREVSKDVSLEQVTAQYENACADNRVEIRNWAWYSIVMFFLVFAYLIWVWHQTQLTNFDLDLNFAVAAIAKFAAFSLLLGLTIYCFRMLGIQLLLKEIFAHRRRVARFGLALVEARMEPEQRMKAFDALVRELVHLDELRGAVAPQLRLNVRGTELPD